MNWNREVVLITGAASGIGRSISQLLSKNGASLSLVDIDKEGLMKTIESSEIRADHVLPIEADVTNESSMNDAIKKTINEFGHLTTTIANAGVGYPTPADKMDLNQVKQMLDINLRGVLNTLVPSIDHMIEQERGHLVIVSSSAAFRGIPGAGTYSATKAGVLRLGESFRHDLQSYNINITTIHPGWIETPMTKPFLDKIKLNEISSEKAASHIKFAIENEKKRYIFPWQMRVIVKLMNIIPETLINLSLNLMPNPEDVLQEDPRKRKDLKS